MTENNQSIIKLSTYRFTRKYKHLKIVLSYSIWIDVLYIVAFYPWLEIWTHKFYYF